MAVHLNSGSRAEVLRGTLPDGLSAGGRSLGIDPVAVWRHAVAADERWRGAATAVSDVRVAFLCAVGVVLSSFFVGIASGVDAWPVVGLVAAVTIMTPFVTRARHRLGVAVRDSVESARSLAGGAGDPRGDEDLDEDERRIDAAQRGNLVVFSRRAPSPFVGSGSPVEHVVMVPVDVGRAAPGATGGPKPFTAVDVHRHLERVLAERSSGEVRPEHRLHLRGDVVSLPGASPWTDRGQPPPTRVGQHWVDAGIARPTGQARTYLCLHRAFNGGWLVVSMFVRVILAGRVLSLETATRALPGLADAYAAPDGAFAAHFDNHANPRPDHTHDSACRAVIGELWRNRLLRNRWQDDPDPVEEDEPTEEAVEAEHDAAHGGRGHDFGATTSLRERVSRGYVADHFETLDAQDFLQRTHRAVVDGLGDFLVAHDVDVSEFRTRREHIINNTTFQIQNVQGTGHHIGTHGQVTNVAAKEDDTGGNQ